MTKLMVAFCSFENAQHTHSVSVTKSNTLLPYRGTADFSEKTKRHDCTL